MKIKISQGRVVDPANDCDEVADVFIDGDTIVGVGRAPSGFKAQRDIDASGLVVCPGFTEIGAQLREPGDEHKATIASELSAAAAGGFTTVCCMPDTSPVIDTPAVVELINQRAKGVRGARVRCIGALTQALEGQVLAEMHALKDIGCVGVSNAGEVIRDTNVLRHALAYASTLDLTVFLNSEDPWLGSQGTMHEGAVSTRLGVPGVSASAELIGLGRDLLLVEEADARAHFLTLSCARSIKYLTDARRSGLDVTADVGIAHLFLCDEDIGRYDSQCHVRPPLRTRRDRTRLRKGLADTQIDALSAHHQPHDSDAKAAPFSATEPGISGLDTFLPLLLLLVDEGAFDLKRAIATAALEPARIVGLDSGALGIGDAADICIFDAAKEWCVSEQTLQSHGKNTPFLGQTMRGKAMLTLVAGRIVYEAKV